MLQKTRFHNKNYEQGPCPSCKSSDAYTEWDNGSAYCFSCGYRPKGAKEDIPERVERTFRGDRGLTETTMRTFYVVTEVVNDHPARIAFPYPSFHKMRSLKEKQFWTKGEVKAQLFGMDKFDPGSAESIVVTEGEYDAMSVYQAMRGMPAVSVRSASSAKVDCIENYDYLNSFNKIIIAFDDDEPGRKHAAKVRSLFDPRKVYSVKFTKHKDANSYLQAGEDDDLAKVIKGARILLPEGVLHTYQDLEDALSDSLPRIMEYPFKSLQSALYGVHSGEFIIFKGPEGIGKTEVFRAIEYAALSNNVHPVGILHLEENINYTLRGLATYSLRVPANMEDTGVSNDDVIECYRDLTEGCEDRCYIKSAMGTDDPDEILSIIRFMASGLGCKVIFLDHLSMLVTGLHDDDERKTLDYLATKIAKMCDELQFAFLTIMHVNDDGRTRSSRYPPKIAHTVIDMQRDIEADTPEERNKTYFKVQKGRAQGCLTGPVGHVVYDFGGTYTLSDPKVREDEVPRQQLEEEFF